MVMAFYFLLFFKTYSKLLSQKNNYLFLLKGQYYLSFSFY